MTGRDENPRGTGFFVDRTAPPSHNETLFRTPASGAYTARSPEFFRFLVDGPVVGENEVAGIADPKVAIDRDAPLRQHFALLDQGVGIEGHPVSDDAELVRMENPRGDQMEDKLFPV